MEHGEDTRHRRRLTPLDRRRDLIPWRRAERLERCALYWIPVKDFPVPDGQRAWLKTFFEKLATVLTGSGQLRSELFLSFKTISELDEVKEQLHRTTLRYSPLLGLSRRPGEKMKPPPDIEKLRKESLDYITGKKKPPTMRELAPDYCYWFVLKYPEEQREHFLGSGGLTMLFLKPDPNTVPPEEATLPDIYFEKVAPNVDKDQFQAMVAGTLALADEFLPKSKELFGKGLEEDPQYPGIAYIVPLLQSQDFFREPDEVVDSWFELFEVYINETPEDSGILLAAKSDIDEMIIEILQEMKDEGLSYPVA